MQASSAHLCSEALHLQSHASSKCADKLPPAWQYVQLPGALRHLQHRLHRSGGHLRRSGRHWQAAAAAAATRQADIQRWVQEDNEKRVKCLEQQALDALRLAVEEFERPAFPCALIAGDVVILELLSRLGYLESGRVNVIFIDTFHLFPETHNFLAELEERYKFKATVFQADGFANKQEYQAVHGSDLYIRDIDEYDRICKVEPFNRSLAETRADVMINGRRRDHGAERAFLEVFEDGQLVKCNPLAWWTFKDCWEYLQRHGVPHHPLHDQGFPSVGDVHSTLPVPKEKWFEYGGERSGRFQGLTNKDGSAKTECGIHVSPPAQAPVHHLSSSLRR